jgi:hypothetical protein
MTTEPLHVERRVGQRFDFHVPVAVRVCGSNKEACGLTQDLSARGSFFYIDFPLVPGESVELTLLMPSEITLGESMPVRCQGNVLRTVPPSVGSKLGVAVFFECYEYLAEPRMVAETPEFSRVSALHARSSVDKSPATVSVSRRG